MRRKGKREKKKAEPPPPPIFVDGTAARGHIVKEPEEFGSFSPRWTISSPRRDSRRYDSAPGPGKYDPPRATCVPKPGPPMAARPNYSYRTVTSNIDYGEVPRDPVFRPMTIGSRKKTYFYIPTDGSPKLFDLPKDTVIRGPTIGKKIPWKPNDNPGPGAYSPRDLRSPKLVTVAKATEKPLTRSSGTPGPGAYSPRAEQKPKWFMSIRPLKKPLYDDEE